MAINAQALPELERAAGWPRRLNEHLIDSQARFQEIGFKWGVFDCCTFAADWVKSATGIDPMADYRGRYASKEQAMALLRERGGGTLLASLTGLFGKSVHPAKGMRGDLAWRRKENALGIVYTVGARQFSLFLGEDGMASLPISACDACFCIGRRVESEDA